MKSSMDWIVWEMLEKLKADKDILTRMRDEAKAICLDMTTVDMLYWKGLVAGYNTQIRWTQDNIDKGDVGMNYNDPKTTEMYVDFLWQTIKYWQQLAAANKDELDYYRDLVKALVNGEMDLGTLKELEGDEEQYGLDSMGDVRKVKGR